MLVRMMRLLLLALAMWGANAAQAATLSCPSASTLESLVQCISLQMPQDSSNGYHAPSATQRSDFQAVYEQMLRGNCSVALPASLSANMLLRQFNDTGNGRSYCVLMEVTDADNDGYVDMGWGTFITYAGATREVAHQAPHPKFNTSTSGSLGDAYSESEAIRIFKQSDSRTFGMCGARRSANTASSTCQSSYLAADCAHNTDNLLYASTRQLAAHYGSADFTVIQWHGMAADTCSETAYVSHGYAANPPPGAKVTAMRDQGRLQLPTWIINTPLTSCSLNATDNPAGRLLNGVPDASTCGTAATSSGFGNKFIHIEQDVPVIGADVDGVSTSWANAVNVVFPAASQSAPAAPSNVSATPGNAQANLSWTASTGATSYHVKRAAVSGGPYSVIYTTTSTSQLDSGLTNGATYYYVVSALNSLGESPDSSQAAATPVAPPAAPTNLAATAGAVGSKSIALTWTASQNAASYNVKRSTRSNGTFSVVGTAGGTSFTDTGLQAGKTYYYYVTATNASGTSGNSNLASAQAQ